MPRGPTALTIDDEVAPLMVELLGESLVEAAHELRTHFSVSAVWMRQAVSREISSSSCFVNIARSVEKLAFQLLATVVAFVNPRMAQQVVVKKAPTGSSLTMTAPSTYSSFQLKKTCSAMKSLVYM